MVTYILQTALLLAIIHPYSWQVWDFFDTSELFMLDFGSQVPKLWLVNQVPAPRDGLVLVLPAHSGGFPCSLI